LLGRAELKDNFVVVGGGLAGYLTALFVRLEFPNAKITVIESKKIGILGAGEGTVRNFVGAMDKLSIPLKRIFLESGSTVKYGIKYTGWSKNPEPMLAGFQLVKTQAGDLTELSQIEIISELSESGNLDKTDLSAMLAVNDIFIDNLSDPDRNNFPGSLHVDAHKIAKLFSDICLERDIQIVDDIVTDITVSDGKIRELILESGSSEPADFVFDCTGFHRNILSKLGGTEWLDYSDILPGNRAMAFTLPNNDSNFGGYTEAIAMREGWSWKIPLQNRYGCGYVHDARLSSIDDIKSEIIEKFGEEVEFLREISFSPGIYKESWIGNCIAIGLASSFVEPLEASSIATAIYSMELATNYILNDQTDQSSIDMFNEAVVYLFSTVVAAILLHYYSDRDDTPFWERFSIDKYLENPHPGLSKMINKEYSSEDLVSNVDVINDKKEEVTFLRLGTQLLFAINNNIIPKEDLLWVKELYPAQFAYAKMNNAKYMNDNKAFINNKSSHLEFIKTIIGEKND
jgi:tryptophan halogenase